MNFVMLLTTCIGCALHTLVLPTCGNGQTEVVLAMFLLLPCRELPRLVLGTNILRLMELLL